MIMLQKEDIPKGWDDASCRSDATELTIVPDHLNNIIACNAFQQRTRHNTDSTQNLKLSAMNALLQVVWGDGKCQHLKTAEGIPPDIIVSAKPRVKEFLTSRIKFAQNIISTQHAQNATTQDEVKSTDDTFKFNRMIRPKKIVVEDNTQCELLSGLFSDLDDLEGLVLDSEMVGSGRSVEDCDTESSARERWFKLPHLITSTDDASKSSQYSASKSVGSSRCRNHMTAATLGKKEREAAWFSMSLVKKASRMDDQSLQDGNLNSQFISHSPTASTVSSVNEEIFNDKTNGMPSLSFESATHCTERTDKNDEQYQPVHGKLQTVKEQSHASNGADRSSNCLSA